MAMAENSWPPDNSLHRFISTQIFPGNPHVWGLNYHQKKLTTIFVCQIYTFVDYQPLVSLQFMVVKSSLNHRWSWSQISIVTWRIIRLSIWLVTILRAGQYLGKTHSADLLPRRANNHLPIIIFGCRHMFGRSYTNFNHIYALILLMISHFLAYSTLSYHGYIPILQANRDASSHYDGSYHHRHFLLSLFSNFAHFSRKSRCWTISVSMLQHQFVD